MAISPKPTPSTDPLDGNLDYFRIADHSPIAARVGYPGLNEIDSPLIILRASRARRRETSHAENTITPVGLPFSVYLFGRVCVFHTGQLNMLPD
jgi:hypothetical protein